MISPAEFQALAAEGYTRIPLVRELLSDLDTPLSVYLKLADGPNAYLFESVQAAKLGRYSIIGLPAKRVYTLRGQRLCIEDCGEVSETREVVDPIAADRCAAGQVSRAKTGWPARL